MRLRFRLVLPAVNVVGAAGLLTYGGLHPVRGNGIGPGPASTVICYLVEAPAALLRNAVIWLWDRLIVENCSLANTETCYSIGNIVEILLFLLAVAVLWYVVGLEIDTRGNERRAAVPSRSEFRAVVDVAFIGAGICFALGATAAWNRSGWERLGNIIVGVPYAAWAVVLILTYGYDLLDCIKSYRKRRTGGPGF
jgi:hypothetical protein